jgi:hypothetical protein
MKKYSIVGHTVKWSQRTGNINFDKTDFNWLEFYNGTIKIIVSLREIRPPATANFGLYDK